MLLFDQLYKRDEMRVFSFKIPICTLDIYIYIICIDKNNDNLLMIMHV